MNKIPIKKMIWPSLLAGVLLVTVCGFYIGKVVLWRAELPLWYWLATVVLVLGSLFILVNLIMEMDGLLAGSVPRGVGFWVLFVLSTFFLFFTGCVLADYFWWSTGKILLASAERDVAVAGYKFGVPENSPQLPDEKNSVYLFNQAWNAPSMRKFGAVAPIFDTPPKGRFEENAKRYATPTNFADLLRQNEFIQQPFFGKKTEWDFLTEFNRDAIAGRLTQKEKVYAHKLVKEHEDAFRFMDMAFETKSVDWGIDYQFEPTWTMPRPKLNYAITFARLLRARAFVQALDGNDSGAVKSLETALFMGDMCGQTRDLIGVMIDTAIVRIITPSTRVIVSHLRTRGNAGVEILPFIQPEKLGMRFSDAMQFECFVRPGFSIGTSWLDFVKDYKFYVFSYAFILFDRAATYETNIQFMKCINNPSGYAQVFKDFQRNGWLLGSIAIPRYPQMIEKVNESMTHCGQVELMIETNLFHQKNKRWPNNGAELEKWGRDNLGISGIAEVKVTSAFASIESKAHSPAGNQVTLAHKGETPKTDGMGWLYDSNSGMVYVNSTVHDSQNMAYSFYGFE